MDRRRGRKKPICLPDGKSYCFFPITPDTYSALCPNTFTFITAHYLIDLQQTAVNDR